MNRTLKFFLIIAGSALTLLLSLLVAGFIMLRSAGWVLTHVLASDCLYTHLTLPTSGLV